jgi:hypothetical protein
MKDRRPTTETVEKWITRGDGQGEGEDYRPFFKVRDVPSKGRSRMVLGLKTGRVHHLLSDIEYGGLLLGEDDPDVVDMKEQFALLPWEETQDIARELGIRYPTYPGTRTPIVMTLDQVFTSIRAGGKRKGAISFKTSSAVDLDNAKTDTEKAKVRRVLEKLMIEKTICERHDLSWRLVTEQDLPLIRIKNLDLLRTSMVATELDWLDPKMTEFVNFFKEYWVEGKALLDILQDVSDRLGIKVEHAFTLFGRAVWLRFIPVDIDTEVIHHQEPLRRLVA